MRKPAPKFIKSLIVILLASIFCVISLLSFSTISHMQGNARVVNYTGIVRGATQQLIKQEMNDLPNDDLIYDLDGIIFELSTGEGEAGLIALPDAEYQNLMAQLGKAWEELKAGIQQVRQGQDKQRLFALSESYFVLADRTVSAAETYSERLVKNAQSALICLYIGLLLFGFLLIFYGRWQKKMETALHTAENASRAKSEFLSSMSHEIRTPMNGIIGMTAIARMSIDDKDKVMDCLKKIDLSSTYLLALINDILDMSRIESGKVELDQKAFDLPALLDRIQVMCRQKAEEGGITLCVNYDGLAVETVIGDDLRISQILMNIISNALKFTPQGGRVTVEAREKAVTKQQVTAEFVISDTGIGISEAFQARLFNAFEQEHAATSRQYGGTGLGLAISQNFVKMMGGEIIVHSRLGEGSQFTVRIPLSRPEKETAAQKKLGIAPLPASREDIPHLLSGTHLLLAEDNEINSEIVSAILENSGVLVDAVFNGQEVLDTFSGSLPGYYKVILMDIQMPVMGGLEASRKIRGLERPDADTVQIIGLSANAFHEDVDKALQSGMNGYLTKPVDMEKLVDTIGCSLAG